MLKTDYKNDKLLMASNTMRKYNVIENEDGTVSFEDVTVYEVKGDHFGADEVNEIHQGLNEIHRGLNELLGVIIIKTLAAGETTMILEDETITTESTIDIYTSVYGVSPTNAIVEAGSITLTFEAQDGDIGVKVRVR